MDTVLIRPAKAPGGGAKALLAELGFAGLAPRGERPYREAMWPERGAVWVGVGGGCTMISSKGLADRFFGAGSDPFVRAVLGRFHGAEIAAVTLHSVLNLWGFAVFRDGVPLRRKAGSADDGTYEEFGEPLPEEQDMLAKSTLDADGRRVYSLAEYPGEAISEDQLGDEYVFRVFERLTGARPDADAALLEAPCAGFSFTATAPGRPWWKLWR